MNIEIRTFEDYHEDRLRWVVTWDCPEVETCGFARWFDTESEAHAFGVRLRLEGCPNSPWFPNEHDDR